MYIVVPLTEYHLLAKDDYYDTRNSPLNIGAITNNENFIILLIMKIIEFQILLIIVNLFHYLIKMVQIQQKEIEELKNK